MIKKWFFTGLKIVLVIVVIQIMAVAFLFVSCMNSENPRIKILEANDRSEYKKAEEIVEALKEKDSEMMKNVFSKTALEEAEDIDGQIEDFFNFCYGEVVSRKIEDYDGIKSKSNAEKEGNSNFYIYITTDEGEYTIYVESYDIDTENPLNEGVYNLELYEGRWGEEDEWYVGINDTAGIHIVEKVLEFEDECSRIERAVAEAVKEKDVELMKSVFSKTALEETEDIEADIEEFFSICQGEIKFYWDMFGGTDDKSDLEYPWYLYSMVFYVTKEEEYTICIYYDNADSLNPDSEDSGIYKIEVYEDIWNEKWYVGIYEEPGFYIGERIAVFDDEDECSVEEIKERIFLILQGNYEDESVFFDDEANHENKWWMQ